MLALLLSLTAYKTLTKAFALYERETLGWAKVETRDIANELELVTFRNRSMKRRHSETNFITENVGSHSNMGKAIRRNSCPPSIDNLKIGQKSTASLGFESQRDSRYSDEPVHLSWEQTPVKGNASCPAFPRVEHTGRENLKQQLSSVGGLNTEDVTLADILREEQQAPVNIILTVVCLFLVVLLLNILKGGGAFPSPVGITCGSVAYWSVEGIILCWIIAVSLHARSYLIERTRKKDEMYYQFVEGDIKWDKRATCVYPSVSWLAGFCAGMFGIGGGIVKGPLMLAMGIHPAVASATSACMIFFTSFTATTSFVVYGLIIADYAWYCLAMGFLATAVGQVVMSRLLKRYKRNSYIVFCIGFVVLLSAVFMIVESVVATMAGDPNTSLQLCDSH